MNERRADAVAGLVVQGKAKSSAHLLEVSSGEWRL